MTSNADTNNGKIALEIDREGPKIYPLNTRSSEQAQMQIARKESSSGFMLLSVKHLSNVKGVLTKNGQEMGTLEECFDDSCVPESQSVHMNTHPVKGTGLELGRNFCSTMSLEAEEYDNYDEGSGSRSEVNNPFQSQNLVLNNPTPPAVAAPSNFNLPQECHSNGQQNVDGSMPVGVSSIAQPTSSATRNAVAQSRHDVAQQTVPTTDPVITNHHPLLFRQINPPVAASTSQDSPGSVGQSAAVASTSAATAAASAYNVAAAAAQIQNQPFQKQNLEHHVFKYSDPSYDSSSQPAVSASVAVAAAAAPPMASMGPQTMSAVALGQVPLSQQFKDQVMNGENMRSISDAPLVNPLLSSLTTAPIQPASRFRKARIHETVEQWSSNRVSVHDCRVKTVPQWLTNLQAKPPDNSFNYAAAHRGKCLYCFVTGTPNTKCTNPKHNQYGGGGSVKRHGRSAPCSLPTVPEAPEMAQLLLQATQAAYTTAGQRGYNLGNLLASWKDGERVQGRPIYQHQSASLMSAEHPFASFSTAVAPVNGLKTNASEPAFVTTASDQVEMAGHNSTDVAEDISLVARSNSHCLPSQKQPQKPPQLPVVPEQVPTPAPPPQSHPVIPPPAAAAVVVTDTNRVTDPSAAYLRRQLTLSNAEDVAPDAAMSNAQTQHPPPPLERHVAPPPASPTHLDQHGLPQLPQQQPQPPSRSCVAPVALDPTGGGSIMTPRSFSNTTAASVQLSPDTEVPSMVTAAAAPVVMNYTSEHSGQQPSPSGVGYPAEISAAARNIVQAAAAAVATQPLLLQNHQQQQQPQQPTSQLPSGGVASTPSSSSVVPPNISALEAQMPKCMLQEGLVLVTMDAALKDVIRVAIMDTLQDQFVHLNMENETLRAAVYSLQQENNLLQSYKRAFFDLRRFFPPEVWEQIEQQARLAEASVAAAADASNQLLQQQHQQFVGQPQQMFFPQHQQPSSSSSPSTQQQQQQQQNSSAFQPAQPSSSPSALLPPASTSDKPLPPPPPPS